MIMSRNNKIAKQKKLRNLKNRKKAENLLSDRDNLKKLQCK